MARVALIAATVVMVALVWHFQREDDSNSGEPKSLNPIEASGAEFPREPSDEDGLVQSRSAVELEACAEEPSAHYFDRPAKLEQFKQQVVAVLRSSSDPEHLMVAALLSWRKQPEQAASLLRRAAIQDPNHPLVAAQSLELCLRLEEFCDQSAPVLETRLIAADPENVWAWVRISLSRLARANEQGALLAMRKAYSAAKIVEPDADYRDAFDRAFAASSDLPSAIRLVEAGNQMSAIVDSSSEIVGKCRRQGSESAEWQNACLRLGERLEAEAQSVESLTNGFQLQMEAYESAGETRQRDLVKARGDDLMSRLEAIFPFGPRSHLVWDDELARMHQEVLTASGQIAAIEFLSKEIPRRLALMDENPMPRCKPP